MNIATSSLTQTHFVSRELRLARINKHVKKMLLKIRRECDVVRVKN